MDESKMLNEYVVGFAFDKDKNVALIRKEHPPWQSGKLNGIGGKVESWEHPRDAMVREFREEANAHIDTWTQFLTLHYPDTETRVNFFKAEVSHKTLALLKSNTDEEVVVMKPNIALQLPIVKNLIWILPFALYTEAIYHPSVNLTVQNRSGLEYEIY